ncbi:Y+L amino acid transporter 2 isoform X1 [Procambarus clarkii]|uniref:Y+L amino acid transporter 2 isoform X1 n=1 Tax=Procambarus clarkii TaxID=6728 RepID=UPI003742984E
MKVNPSAPPAGKDAASPRPGAHADDAASNTGTSGTPSETLQLRKELGLLDSIVLVISIVSGSGIFISARGVLQYSGSVGVALLTWALSGVVSLIGAITFSEFATMIPVSGGFYTYISVAFGPAPAFVHLWVNIIIVQPTMQVVNAYTFGYYVLRPFFPDDPPDAAIRLLAAALIVLLAWINSRTVRVSVALQNVLMIPKLMILAGIIITGLYYLATDLSPSYHHPFHHTRFYLPALITAFYQGIYTYDGWNNLNMVVEEIRNPSKIFALASGVSMGILTVVFVLTNVAYFAVLTPEEVRTSTAVALSFGNAAFGVLAITVPVAVAISALASLNGQTFTQSRLVFVGARQRQLPKFLALITIKRNTPAPAIIFMTMVTLVMLGTTDVYALINCSSFSRSISRIVATSGLLWLRYKKPEWKRPFKVWVVLPVVYLLVMVVLVTLPAVEEPVTVGVALAVIASGILVFFLLASHTGHSRRLDEISGGYPRFTVVSHLLTHFQSSFLSLNRALHGFPILVSASDSLNRR